MLEGPCSFGTFNLHCCSSKRGIVPLQAMWLASPLLKAFLCSCLVLLQQPTTVAARSLQLAEMPVNEVDVCAQALQVNPFFVVVMNYLKLRAGKRA